MAINFPDSPNNGDSFTSNNKTWVFDGTVWNITSGTNSVADGAITTAKLASNAVHQTKLASNLSGITITTTANRDTDITSPFTGQFAFLTDTNAFIRWDGSAWVTAIVTTPTEAPTSQVREGFGILMSEFLGSLILLFVIHHRSKSAQHEVPLAVALIVTAGYWFTSSTFFCNPAVTVARSMTNTFVGIHPGSVLGFIVSQVSATVLFILVTKSLNKKNVMGS